jgi:hypothetical protein
MSAGPWYTNGLAIFAGEGALAVPVARVMPGPHAELDARLIAAAPELHDALREVLLADLRRTIARDPALAAEPAPAEAQRAMRLLASIHGLQMPPGGPRPDPFGGKAA